MDLHPTEEAFWLWLDWFGGARLAELPPGITLRRQLVLSNNQLVDGLPDNLTVKGGVGVYLNGCVNLRALPDGLRVFGVLDAIGCYSLLTIGRGCQVDGPAFFQDCPSLKSIPCDFHCSGEVWVDDHMAVLGGEGLKIMRIGS